MNVAVTCDLHIAAKTAECRRNALDGHISAIRRHVPPKRGERELADIRRKEVREWVDSIAAAGAAAKALKMPRQVFRRAIKQFELEISDPTRGVEPPVRPIYRREAMTAKEIAYMLREAVGKPWEADIILAAALGLRPSEALGVDWSDIGWRSGRVHIQRGCRTPRSGETAEHPCKTRLSDRHLEPPRWALARLRQIRGRRRRGRVRGDLTPRQAHAQHRRFLKSIGLGRCPIEGLRHSRATLAIASGAAIADVSVAMGRTATRMVVEHYMMSTRAVSERATDAAGRAIEEGLEAYAMAAQLSSDSKNAIKLRDKTDCASLDWKKGDDGQIRLSVYVGNALVHSMMPNWGEWLWLMASDGAQLRIFAVERLHDDQFVDVLRERNSDACRFVLVEEKAAAIVPAAYGALGENRCGRCGSARIDGAA